jgi:hypothetical protein
MDYSALVSQNAALQRTINLDYSMGTNNRAPKLLSWDEYPTWAERFEHYVYGSEGELWLNVQEKYECPKKPNTVIPMALNELKKEDRDAFLAEKKMYHLITSSIEEGILHQFRSYTTSYDLWQALDKRYFGDSTMVHARAERLKWELQNFIAKKDEDTNSVISRYCNLVSAIHKVKILCYIFSEEDLAKRLINALPEKWDMYVESVLKPNIEKFKTVSDVVANIQGKEMELKMKEELRNKADMQNPSLYKGHLQLENASPGLHIESPPIPVAFVSSINASTENVHQTIPNQSSGGHTHTNQPSHQYTQGQSSASPFTSNTNPQHQAYPSNTTPPPPQPKHFDNVNACIAQEHMEILSALLTSYDDLVAGRIGNYNMTKEDYDQIDPEEMELMDIQWNLASVVRKAQRFMEVTGRKDFGNPNAKLGFDKGKVICYNCGEAGHFKRECQKQKSAATHNPFQKKENFNRQLITHRNQEVYRSPQPQQQQQQQHQQIKSTAHANVVSTGASSAVYTEPGTGALVVHGDEGFSWDSIFSESANIAKIVDEAVNEVLTSERLTEVIKDQEQEISEVFDECVEKLKEVMNEAIPSESPEKLDFSEVLNKHEECKSESTDNLDGYSTDGSSSSQSSEESSIDSEKKGYLEKATLAQVYEAFMAKLNSVRASISETLNVQNDEKFVECEECKMKHQKIVTLSDEIGFKNDDINKLTDELCLKTIDFDNLSAKYQEFADDYNRLNESHHVMKLNEDDYRDKMRAMHDENHDLKNSVMFKQETINGLMDELAKTKTDLAKQKFETERVSGKLETYLHSAYIIDRIYPSNGKDLGISKSFEQKQTKVYAKIPDPDICHNLTKFPDSFSLTDLPEDLDFDYSKYSEWMANKGIKFEKEQTTGSETQHENETQLSDFEDMVESLVSDENESLVDEEMEFETENGFSENVETDDFEENEHVFDEKTSESKTDGKVEKLFTLKGSKIMYSENDFPIESVDPNQIDKVFLVVSEEPSEVSDETSNCSKESTKHQKKVSEKSPKSSNLNGFVSGHIQTETISVGTTETNHHFRVKTKGNEKSDMHPRVIKSPKDIYGDRTCYSCRKVGHMAKDCPLNKRKDASESKPVKTKQNHYSQKTTVLTNGTPISKGTIKSQPEVVKSSVPNKNKSSKPKQTVNKPQNEIKVTKILNRNEPIPDGFKKPSGNNFQNNEAKPSGSPKKTTGLPK